MRVIKFHELFESNLNTKELIRQNGPETSGDILVKKLKDTTVIPNGITHSVVSTIVIDNHNKDSNSIEKNIQVINSEDIVDNITTNGKFDIKKATDTFVGPNKRYKEIFKDIDGKLYKLNDLKKTKDFGSSGGSSLGSASTRDVESIQCFILSYRQIKKSSIKKSDIEKILKLDDEQFNNCKKYIYTPVDITKELLEKYKENKSWMDTFIKTANYLYENQTTITEDKRSDFILNSNIEYEFIQMYGNHKISKSLRLCFKSFNQKVDISKWNPSDIWAVNIKKIPDINEKLGKVYTRPLLKNLNLVIDQYFDSRDLIGISLKKIGSNKDVNMIINKVTPLPNYVFSSIKLSKKPLSTIGIQIEARRISQYGNSVEYMGVRSSGGPLKLQNVIGEMYSKVARQGSINLNKINSILIRYGLEPIPLISNLMNMDILDIKREIIRLNNKLFNHYKREAFVPENTDDSNLVPARIYSKYQALLIGEVLMNNEKENFTNPIGIIVNKSNEIVEEIFHYALSIKYNRLRTPKYVRVID